MNESRIFADEYQTSFANTTEMLEFLQERGKSSTWIRKPTKLLRLMALKEGEEEYSDVADLEILEDTQKNTQLILKVKDESYPIRDCAIKTILDRAGINGNGLRKLERQNYARVINYCLKVAKGDALIKIADGKVSAIHGGDEHDYNILEMQDIFEMTIQYLNLKFPGSSYVNGSGTYDHSVVSAMWELGGSQELLDTYRKALCENGLEDNIIAPVLRLTTSDVAISGANLYPMLLCNCGNRTISLGSPIKLAHKSGASLDLFYKNLQMLYSRYTDAIADISKLMSIDIKNPLNCLMLIMKRIGIKKKIANQVLELYEAQSGNASCTAHDLYFALNEASFFGACEGLQGYNIIVLEENITKALSLDWKEYDVPGSVKW